MDSKVVHYRNSTVAGRNGVAIERQPSRPASRDLRLSALAARPVFVGTLRDLQLDT